jgi:ABC-2 type transport system permease protein
MNILVHELKAYRKSIIIWSCSMVALAVMYMLVFKSLGQDIEVFKEFINNLPDVMKKAFNIYAGSITTLVGFYASIFSFILLCGAIQAMNLGTSVVSKEISDKTADFLMTKPRSRNGILSSKLLAAFISLIITNIIYLGITIPVALISSDEVDMKLFLTVSATLFFVQLIFMTMGLFAGIIARKIKSVISLSLSTVFGFYIIGTLGAIIGEENARYISPFRFFDTAYIMQNMAYETSYMIEGIIFVIAAVAASYLVYMKKDIHAV